MKIRVLTFALTAMSFFSAASVQAGVVLSNMGANGLTDTASSGNTNTDILSTNLLAAGFSTGGVAQRLDWISMVTFNNDSGTKVVEIYTDNAGNPGSLFATSTATSVGGRGVYRFYFSDDLAASTSYWVRPAVGLSWYIEDNGDAPSAQNASGFASTGYRRSTDGGSSWLNSGNKYTLGISTSDVPPPVPEPALTSLLCLGGIAFMRRRMSK